MGQVRHGCATTTHAVRAAIQRSQASLATLSRELGINPKTVAKWRKRATVEDLKTGPKAPHSTTLSQAEEAMVVAFRRHTLLPLDDCLYSLQPSIPHLTRSVLHRRLQRHGIKADRRTAWEFLEHLLKAVDVALRLHHCTATLVQGPSTPSRQIAKPIPAVEPVTGASCRKGRYLCAISRNGL